MLLSILARVLAATVTIYMLACSVRIFLTWVPGNGVGRAGELLASIVDPYLRFFARFRIFRVGHFDFSPIAALSLLAVANQVFLSLAFSGPMTLGGVFSLAIDALWSALAFIITFLAVATLARLIAYSARWNSLHPLWRVVDDMLNPLLFRMKRLIWRDRVINYQKGLIAGFAILVVVRVAGEALVGFLLKFLRSLPI